MLMVGKPSCLAAASSLRWPSKRDSIAILKVNFIPLFIVAVKHCQYTYLLLVLLGIIKIQLILGCRNAEEIGNEIGARLDRLPNLESDRFGEFSGWHFD